MTGSALVIHEELIALIDTDGLGSHVVQGRFGRPMWPIRRTKWPEYNVKVAGPVLTRLRKTERLMDEMDA